VVPLSEEFKEFFADLPAPASKLAIN
jgi:hypothetical protein